MGFSQKLKKARNYVRGVFSRRGNTNTVNIQLFTNTNPAGMAGGQSVNSGTSAAASSPPAQATTAQGSPVQTPQVIGSTSAKNALKGLTTSLVLKPIAGAFGPLKQVSDMFKEFADIYEMTGTNKEAYNALQARLETLLDDLSSQFDQDSPPVMTSSMKNLRKSIEDELELVKNRQDKTLRRQYLEAKDEADVILACYQRIEGYLERLSLNADLSMWKVAEEHIAEYRSDRISSRVDRLPLSLSAWYNSAEGAELKRRGCTPGTRINVLTTILDWVRGGGQETIYWLNGMAGTGKTTIAYSICDTLDAEHKLGASFFCSRMREECRNVNVIIPSIAYQLARFSRPFQSALAEALAEKPDVHGSLPHAQFEALIAEPLLKISHTLPEGLIVVIDALDECESGESVKRMLDVLLSKATSLPIKFIVSSRPEPQIRDQMTTERAKSRLVLHELDKGEVQTDIEAYLRAELVPMKPSEEQISALVERAGILFIYAATAVRYIGYDNFQSNPEDRLRVILEGSGSQEDKESEDIDQLYMTILDAALGNPRLRRVERDNMQQVLHTVICAREPLTVLGLSMLLEINSVERVRAALRPLWSVLHVVGTTELVTTLHASFPDFMFNSARSVVYHCDPNFQHYRLAEYCLKRVKRIQLEFNICGLVSSYVEDEKVPNIEQRVASAIPLELFYACRYWADHVNAGQCISRVAEELYDFLSTKLLVWMEVLNLRNQMSVGMECMKLTVGWRHELETKQELAELAYDAKRFVDAFASNPVSQSTPHLYVSMLAFWPRSGPIFKHYKKYANGLVEPEGTALDHRQLAHLASWSFKGPVTGMAMSPDGLCIAVATNGSVLLIDSSSGRVVLGPLKCPEWNILCIAFLPDGTQIVSASSHTSTLAILGWDTRTGDPVTSPLQIECDNIVHCASFSPDCTRIASGGHGKYVWDTKNGEMLTRLDIFFFCEAVAFSSNGAWILASSGGRVQGLDSQSGATIFLPSTEYGDEVTSLDISPDGTHIVYGGLDSTMYACSTKTRKVVLGPIKWYGGGITSIRYSPDGKYIVSGSNDQTVRVWDAQNGNMVLGPLGGHAGKITSIAFSPDKARIITGCEGGILCTWDAQTHNQTQSNNCLNAPSGSITSAKFSPDGTRFVLGSADGMVHILNALNGETIVGPLRVHSSSITAIDTFLDWIALGFSDGIMCVCDAPSGDIVLGPLSIYSASETGIQAVAYSPNSKLIATGAAAARHTAPADVDIWDAQTGQRVIGPLHGLKGTVLSVKFSPDVTRVAASSQAAGTQGFIVVWDVQSGENVFGHLEVYYGDVYAITYSHNGTLIASGLDDGSVHIWDAYTGKKTLSPLKAHTRAAHLLEFSPDNMYIVSASASNKPTFSSAEIADKTIKIWDARTGEMVLELSYEHIGGIISLAYSPDGTRILVSYDDTSLYVYDVRSNEVQMQSSPTPAFTGWAMNKEGWIVDKDSRLLAWVPGDLRRTLMLPRIHNIISPHGYLSLKFHCTHKEESWAECYPIQAVGTHTSIL
ncbi:unnamed protein product [Rhizoctonia solani]|uniref:NACHT domain-containing protein n=1 Tax=Rhizoctonia solani TaxID=456999 RepID=A0A8H2WYK6_9AGAM|nr:unnamed protein product [Rhizoctonia solani]CAE6462857.1 unnamed protein product [Rhizoctonia solani]